MTVLHHMIPKVQYQFPLESFRLLKRSLWSPLVLYGLVDHLHSPNGPLWRLMAPFWPSNGYLRARYGTLWTLMAPFKPLIHSFEPYIGLLY